MIALSIIGILLIAAVPVLMNFVSTLELGTEGQRIVSDLRFAQEKAIALSSEVMIDFRSKSLLGDPGRYYIKRLNPVTGKFVDLKFVKLPKEFDIRQEVVIKFAKTGFPQVGGSGTVVIEDLGERAKRIVVSSAGRIRME
jgi:Tfp pilus assembly protein FimT